MRDDLIFCFFCFDFYLNFCLFIKCSGYSPLFTTFPLYNLSIHHFYPLVNPPPPLIFILKLNKKILKNPHLLKSGDFLKKIFNLFFV